MKTKVIQELVNAGKGDITANRRVVFDEVPFEDSAELLQLAEMSGASEEAETAETRRKKSVSATMGTLRTFSTCVRLVKHSFSLQHKKFRWPNESRRATPRPGRK